MLGDCSLSRGSDCKIKLLGTSIGLCFLNCSSSQLSCPSFLFAFCIHCSNPNQSNHWNIVVAGRKSPPSPPRPPTQSWLYLRRTLIKAFENVCSLEIKYLKALPCCLPHPPSNRLSPRQGNACLKAESVSVFTSSWPSPCENLPDHELVLWMDDCCPPGTELTSQTSLFPGMQHWSQSKDKRPTFPVAYKPLLHLQMFVPKPMFAEHRRGERKNGPLPVQSILKEQRSCE